MSGRPKEYDDETVLQAAMDVFWSHGYEASSTQALCESTGLGKGSLYHAFGSKQKLYEQALKRYQELGLQAQKQILHSAGSAKERLKALMLWGMEIDLDGSERGCMALFSVMERSHDPVTHKINQSYVQKIEALLCQVVAQGQAQGELSQKLSSLTIVRSFLASYYGLRILGRSMPDRAFLLDVIDGTISQL